MSTTHRLAWCTLLCLAPIAPIAARLSRLQILERRALASRASEEIRRVSIEVAPRGRILDRSGRILAESVPAQSSFLDPRAVREPRRVAAALVSEFRLPSSEARRRLESPSRFVWLKRRMSPSETQALERMRLDGIGIAPDQARVYPNGDLARGLLGLVGSEGKGLSGIELQYDAALAGKPVVLRRMRDGSGRGVLLQAEETVRTPPDLRLALDRNFQHYAEAALEEGVARYHPQKGAILVQDPKTGDILAAASYPNDPMRAYPMQDAYEPGSTYKLVTMAAALDEKLVKTGELIDGENGRWEITPSVFIKDHEPSGPMSLDQVLERSSNIGSAKLGLRLGPERFYGYARAFGFGSKTSLAYPGENPGLLKPPGEMTRVVLANNAFGQGVAVSLLQLLAAYSAIANGGVLMEPRLVLSAGGRASPAPARVRRAASQETARRLTGMLEGVVERGTAMSAQVPGYSVAGKTGTAQKIDPSTGKYSTTQYVASFIGFAPARDPKFTVLVLIVDPKNRYYGSDVAAPLFAKLMRELLVLDGVAADRPIRDIRQKQAASALRPVPAARNPPQAVP